MWPDELMPPDVGMMASTPQAPGMLPQPNVPMPEAPPPKPSLWQRIQQGLMPVPKGYEGLLAQPDIDMARHQGIMSLGAALMEAGGPTTGPRVSLGQGLARGLQQGQSTFENMLQNATKISSFAEEQRQAKEDRAKAQRMESEREKVMLGAMQGVDPKNPADVAKRLNAVLPDLLRIGDTKGYGALSGYLAANNALLNQQPKARDIRTVVTGTGPGAELIYYDNDSGEELRREPLSLKAGSEAQNEMNAQRRFTRENMLADDFDRNIKDMAEAAQAYKTGVSMVPAARAGDPQAQHALVFSTMHTIEPSSIVMPGEYATFAKQRGLSEEIQNIFARLDKGSQLTPAQVDRVANVLAELAKSRSAKSSGIVNRFKRRAKDWQISDTFIYDPFAVEADSAPGPLGPGQSMVMPGAAPTIRNYLKPPQ